MIIITDNHNRNSSRKREKSNLCTYSIKIQTSETIISLLLRFVAVHANGWPAIAANALCDVLYFHFGFYENYSLAAIFVDVSNFFQKNAQSESKLQLERLLKRTLRRMQREWKPSQIFLEVECDFNHRQSYENFIIKVTLKYPTSRKQEKSNYL